MVEGEEYLGGRFRYVADVLLHEMIHQWQYEVVGKTEVSYHGHGTIFRDKANEIGAKLGLPPVRVKHGKDKDVPLCQYFAHAIRPDGYYLRAHVPARKDRAGTDRLAREVARLVARYGLDAVREEVEKELEFRKSRRRSP